MHSRLRALEVDDVRVLVDDRGAAQLARSRPAAAPGDRGGAKSGRCEAVGATKRRSPVGIDDHTASGTGDADPGRRRRAAASGSRCRPEPSAARCRRAGRRSGAAHVGAGEHVAAQRRRDEGRAAGRATRRRTRSTCSPSRAISTWRPSRWTPTSPHPREGGRRAEGAATRNSSASATTRAGPQTDLQERRAPPPRRRPRCR